MNVLFFCFIFSVVLQLGSSIGRNDVTITFQCKGNGRVFILKIGQLTSLNQVLHLCLHVVNGLLAVAFTEIEDMLV